MKKLCMIKLLCFLVYVLFAANVFAQYDVEYNPAFPTEKKEEIKRPKANVVKFAPLALLFGQIPLAAEARIIYELVAAPRQSYYIGVSFNFQNYLTGAVWDSVNTQNSTDMSAKFGFRVQGGYKFYVIRSQTAPNGLYIGPHASYNFVRVTDSNYPGESARIVYMNANFIGGYQMLLGDRFVMELVTGIGYRRNYVDYYQRRQRSDRRDIWEKGFKVTINYNIGFFF